jgi:dipeptidyl-peptidase 4
MTVLFVVAGILCPPLSPWAAVHRSEVKPEWIGQGARFWYRNLNRDGTREFVLVDGVTGVRRPAFDHAAVARQIGEGVEASRLPVDHLVFDEERDLVRLEGGGRVWDLELSSGDLKSVERVHDAEAGLKPLRHLERSVNGGGESELVLENRLDRPVRLFWVDPAGKRQSYGVIQSGGKRAQHTFAGHVWVLTDLEGDDLGAFAAGVTSELAVLHEGTPRPTVRRRPAPSVDDTVVASPDRSMEVFVREDQLWVRRLNGAGERPLTRDGTSSDSFHRDAVRARAMGMNYDLPDHAPTLPDVIWSPDSKYLIAFRTTVVEEPRVYLVESSPADQLQPRFDSYPYLKAGDPIPTRRLYLFDMDAEEAIEVDRSLFETPWDLSRFVWSEDSSRFFFLYNQRGHQVVRLIEVTPRPEDGRGPGEAGVRVVVEERSETFIDYSNKTYLHLLADSDELIWMSERDGWNHLYLHDLKTGRLKNPITRGNWVVRGVDRVDEKSRQIWFRAMGYYPDQDPYYVHHFRVGFDGTGLVALTEADGTHTIQWSPDRTRLIDTWSRVDQPPVHDLRDGEIGRQLCRLETADASEVLAGGRVFPERFVAMGRDGKTRIYGIIHRPARFDPSQRYPVVENIYAGPHGQHVPKSFRAGYRHQQEIADRGFVVVQIDGMGTNWRSKSFHDVAWKNLRDAGFPDRMEWIRTAARSFPWIDLSRVGIYGGSAGGQNAMRAVLEHAEFYQAAAADCGCHDNRMDKIWWNEAWMGWPVDESYKRSSNLEDAAKLGGHLLLTVGELDRNVDPSSTLQVVNALLKAGKPFEFMLMTGGGHGSGESDYGRKLRADFFVKHLLGEGDEKGPP